MSLTLTSILILPAQSLIQSLSMYMRSNIFAKIQTLLFGTPPSAWNGTDLTKAYKITQKEQTSFISFTTDRSLLTKELPTYGILPPFILRRPIPTAPESLSTEILSTTQASPQYPIQT